MDVDPGSRPDLWSGTVAWSQEHGAWQSWRLRPEDEAYAYSDLLYNQARIGNGVRLEARASASSLTVALDRLDSECGPVDAVVDGRLLVRRTLDEEHTVLRVELPPGTVTLELWLPHHGRVRVRAAQLDDIGMVAARSRRPHWLAYGSSITQCAASAGPTQTWPALVARTFDWDLTSMGFGASCHLDPAVPRAFGNLELDVITLCLGVNIQGQATFSLRSLPGQVAELVRRTRELQPEAEIVLMSPIACPRREATPNTTGLTLAGIRDVVERIGRDLAAAGDTRLHVLDGRTLLAENEAHLLHDGLHPSGEGYGLIAERMTSYLRTSVPALPTGALPSDTDVSVPH